MFGLGRVLETATLEFHVEQDSAGRAIDFTHAGLIMRVEVDGPVVRDIAAEDVRGITLATAADVPRFSPLVRAALRLFPALAV
ncbi:hypothetical protein GCM10029976_024850 [Kribbella albertanoniae]|uniref:hypothetical protein n=1 Tax=Kribbella albertanoniae TaxID=1266829 RepID=UPI001EE0CE74|nr:hypothetical protein [Kribbella albertanoniae]